MAAADELDDLLEKIQPVANNPSDRMDTQIHSEFLCQEDQEAGGTANHGRKEESGALLGEVSACTSHS